MSSTGTNIMSEFSQSNAKLMATALFLEYVAYAAFSIYDAHKNESPQYIYVNEQMAEEMKKAAEKGKRDKEAKKANAQKDKDAKKALKDKGDKGDKGKKDKKDKKDKKEEGKVEHEGGEEERGRGVAKRADKGAAKESKKPPQKRNQENEELCRDYEKWEMRNNNTISKIIANTFPKYFLFFAL
mmetsp:Transcript_17568/g.15483  ORF Transcript_17568/g.15483 Transcript_17568/m.15483 type:complete len:184 (-) Transcript_17568:251-802(-)